MSYSKKMMKDSIEVARKYGKANLKVIRVSDQFLDCIFNFLYELNETTHMYFPYKLIESFCISSSNRFKILSTLLSILKLGPDLSDEDLMKGTHAIPKTTMAGLSNEIIKNYSCQGFKLLSLKILHMLSILSKHQSLSSAML